MQVVKDLNPSNNVKVTSLTIGDIAIPDTGSDIIRNSGDANYSLRIRDTQAVWEFRSRNFRRMNPANPANGTEMTIHDTGNDYNRVTNKCTGWYRCSIQLLILFKCWWGI